MNENRSVFALDGITGMLIATVLLLSILAYLSVSAMSVQHNNASNFYKMDASIETKIQRISTDNAKLAFQPADKK